GGLVVVLGGDKGGPDPAAYADRAADEVLPARPEQAKKVSDETERFWAELVGDGQALGGHPFLAPFRLWKAEGRAYFTDEGRPRASKFWKVAPAEGADVVTHYTDKAASPALLERTLGRGRVLMFTTALDPESKEWNQYYGLSSFGFVLSQMAIEYLAG